MPDVPINREDFSFDAADELSSHYLLFERTVRNQTASRVI